MLVQQRNGAEAPHGACKVYSVFSRVHQIVRVTGFSFFLSSSVPHHRRDEYPTPGEFCVGVVSSCECRGLKFVLGTSGEAEGMEECSRAAAYSGAVLAEGGVLVSHPSLTRAHPPVLSVRVLYMIYVCMPP